MILHLRRRDAGAQSAFAKSSTCLSALRVIVISSFACLFAGVGWAGESPLVDAAKHADKDALRTLISKKVDVNTSEPDGTTALHWAAYRDDVDSAELLIRAG